MQKSLLMLLALAAALGAAAVLYHPAQSQTPAPAMTPAALATTTLEIRTKSGTATVVVEVADADPARARGLGGRSALAEGRGMWFVFETDALWSFWMKDTLIPLDMLWVARDGTIVTIAHGVQPDTYPQAFGPTHAARYVLEVAAGFARRHGVAEGDKVVVR